MGALFDGPLMVLAFSLYIIMYICCC